jgi:uncharacterized membrane protein YdcZ (DUF606 family)
MNASTVLSWIPGWLGFLALILVGGAMTINGAVNKGLDPANKLGFIVFGICAVLVGAFSWIAGGTSKIKGREGTVGVKVAVQDLPWWAWIVDVGLVGIAILIFMVGK